MYHATFMVSCRHTTCFHAQHALCRSSASCFLIRMPNIAPCTLRSFVQPGDHARVVMRINAEEVEVVERRTQERILHTALRDVSQITIGPRKGNLK